MAPTDSAPSSGYSVMAAPSALCSPAPVLIRARLPHPPGINATYRAGQGRVYMTPAAKAWKDAAVLLLRAAGARSQPPGEYRLGVHLALCTRRLDLDAPIKLALDAIATVLGLDDRCIDCLTMVKVEAATPAAQHLDVSVIVERIAS